MFYSGSQLAVIKSRNVRTWQVTSLSSSILKHGRGNLNTMKKQLLSGNRRVKRRENSLQDLS